MQLPLFSSVHYCNPIAGNQEPNFPILCCNKTQLSPLDSILIQFGAISIWALAAEWLAWCQTDRLGDGGTRARAVQSYADLNMNAVWLKSRLKQIEWYLRVRLRIWFRGWLPVLVLYEESLSLVLLCARSCSRDVKQCWMKSRLSEAQGNDVLMQKGCVWGGETERERELLSTAALNNVMETKTFSTSLFFFYYVFLKRGWLWKIVNTMIWVENWKENITFLCNSLM